MKHYFTLTEGATGLDAVAKDGAQDAAEGASKAEVLGVQDKSNDAAAKEQPQQSGGSGWSMWIMLALIFGVMWFFMIRPQRKQQKELQKFRDALKRGDKVVTIGGIYGTVVEIKDASVLIEVDNGVKIRVSKQALIKDFSESQQ
jgi:preprotein translocase subunit YajC